LVLELTVALITTAAIGLHFNATRSLGMAAVAALAFIYPMTVAAALISAVVAFYLPKLLTTERKSS
jgi:hypothetical protein